MTKLYLWGGGKLCLTLRPPTQYFVAAPPASMTARNIAGMLSTNVFNFSSVITRAQHTAKSRLQHPLLVPISRPTPSHISPASLY